MMFCPRLCKEAFSATSSAAEKAHMSGWATIQAEVFTNDNLLLSDFRTDDEGVSAQCGNQTHQTMVLSAPHKAISIPA